MWNMNLFGWKGGGSWEFLWVEFLSGPTGTFTESCLDGTHLVGGTLIYIYIYILIYILYIYTICI